MSNMLKSQVKSGAAQMIENQLPALPPAFAAARLPARPTPRGGCPREDCLPPSERPFCLSGQPRV